MDKLPTFSPQPEQFEGRLTPVIAETRITLPRMLDMVGITSYYDVAKTKDWQEDRFRTPENPYTTWLHDGSRNVGKSIEIVRNTLKPLERGGTIYDGIALYLKDPKILKHHFLDFPGLQVDADEAPYLDLWNDQPRLDHDWVDAEGPEFGSVVAGR